MNLDIIVLKEYLKKIVDPRINRRKRHLLHEILVVAICAIICGEKTFKGMEIFCQNRLGFLRMFIILENGAPSHDTFRRVFILLNFNLFQKNYIFWMESLNINFEGENISIDGKILRRSFMNKGDNFYTHIVSAWSSKHNLVIGEVKVAQKSNEIVAIPELLNRLDLKGATVSIDAIGLQKDIAEIIVEQGADYVIAVKENQPNLCEQITNLFKEGAANNFSNLPHDILTQKETRVHGRIETREYRVINETSGIKNAKDWSSLNAIGAVYPSRLQKNDSPEKTEAFVRYYAISKKMTAKEFEKSVRGHWGIENGLHWILDNIFREDECRVRTLNAPANLSIIRHIALSFLKNETTRKDGIELKQNNAAGNESYFKKMLGLKTA